MLTTQKSANEFMLQINEAIKLSPHYAAGMSAACIGDGGLALYQDGKLLDTPQAKNLLTNAVLGFSLLLNH